MVLLQIDVCCEALAQISLNLPSPGEGNCRADAGSLGRGGQAPSSHLGAQTLASHLRQASQGRLRSGPPGYGRVCPGHSPCAPGSPEEPWGFKPPLPTRFSAPSPSPFGLRRSRPAQTCLLLSPAGRQGADPFQGTGEGWGMLRPAGRPRVLHPDPPRLSPAWVLPTPSGGSFLWSFPRHSFLCQGGSRLLGLELQQ